MWVRYGLLMRGLSLSAFLLLGLACGRGESAAPAVPTAPTAPTLVVDTAFAAQHAERIRDNPPGLALELRVDGTQTQFRLGEPIPLIITFSSTGSEPYEVSVHEYDRSGRMWSETFFADPVDDATDPLLSYFRGGMGGMGGISPLPPPLSDGPVEIPLTLNEWVRFDKSGRHQLFITSDRAGKPATTNIIEIEIKDDPEWAAAEVGRIRAVLAADRKSDEAAAALRALRFLATNDAATEIAAQLCIVGEEFVSPLHLGAHGVRDRQHMISALETGLAAPDCAVSGQYLGTLTSLKMADDPTPTDWAKASRAVMDPAVKALDAALDSKTPRARAVSTHAVLARMRKGEHRSGAADPEADKRRAELASVFEKLPDDARARVLTHEWLTIRTPALTPVLARMVRSAVPRGGRLRSLSDLALERWLDLDSKSARAFILDELAREGGARVSFTPKTLGLLRERTLPRLDAALIAGARAPAAGGLPVSDGATLELRSEVIARYASPAVLADVWELYRASTYFRMSLLTYLVREDPIPATKIINTLGFDDVRRLALIEWSPAVQNATVAHLEQPEPNRADRAAMLLGTYADPSVLPALWKRLAAIDRAKLTAGSAESNLHRRLRQTIATSVAWTLTAKELEPLAKHCVDEQCRTEVASYLKRWNDGKPAFVLWSHAANGGVTGWLGQYSFNTVPELEQKMLQLPRGTVLVWGTKPDEVDAVILAQVEAWADARGVILQRPPLAADAP